MFLLGGVHRGRWTREPIRAKGPRACRESQSARYPRAVTRLTIDELLEQARSRLERLDPLAAHAALAAGALLVDIRSEVQRERDGAVPGSHHFPRNVLEWRLDPTSGAPDPVVSSDLAAHVILMCDEGYQSSLAAATLQTLGFHRATDVCGGFQAWRAAGLPVVPA